MKKWYMTFVCFGLIALLTACQSKISREEAYDIALKDAAVSESDVTLTKETTEDDEYQFEFHTSTQSFEYEISKSGKIEERTVTNYQATEAEKKNSTNGDNTAHDNTNQSLTAENSDAIQGSTEQPTTPLTQEQALEKVYAHFQVTEDTVTNLKVKTDMENGQEVYDIEFDVGNKEYSCEINIQTGELISYDVDNR